MSDSPNIILIDTNKDGQFSSQEIIPIAASDSSKKKHLTPQETKAGATHYTKSLKICAAKERVMDKSFEL